MSTVGLIKFVGPELNEVDDWANSGVETAAFFLVTSRGEEFTCGAARRIDGSTTVWPCNPVGCVCGEGCVWVPPSATSGPGTSCCEDCGEDVSVPVMSVPGGTVDDIDRAALSVVDRVRTRSEVRHRAAEDLAEGVADRLSWLLLKSIWGGGAAEAGRLLGNEYEDLGGEFTEGMVEWFNSVYAPEGLAICVAPLGRHAVAPLSLTCPVALHRLLPYGEDAPHAGWHNWKMSYLDGAGHITDEAFSLPTPLIQALMMCDPVHGGDVRRLHDDPDSDVWDYQKPAVDSITGEELEDRGLPPRPDWQGPRSPGLPTAATGETSRSAMRATVVEENLGRHGYSSRVAVEGTAITILRDDRFTVVAWVADHPQAHESGLATPKLDEDGYSGHHTCATCGDPYSRLTRSVTLDELGFDRRTSTAALNTAIGAFSHDVAQEWQRLPQLLARTEAGIAL